MIFEFSENFLWCFYSSDRLFLVPYEHAGVKKDYVSEPDRLKMIIWKTILSVG